MPIRSITVDGRTWRVYPSGFLTQYTHDEFGVLFVTGEGDEREVRVTRYSASGDRGRERSLHEQSDAWLAMLLAHSQSSEMAPELGYRRSPLPARADLPPRLAAGRPLGASEVAARLGRGDSSAGSR